jgi:hypothetical protein
MPFLIHYKFTYAYLNKDIEVEVIEVELITPTS